MNEERKTYTKEEILAIMPQQPPFLFIDTVNICGNEAESFYKIKESEVFLEGHFKGNPVFPGTIMLEALGQLGVFYLLKSGNSEFGGRLVDAKKIFFISCDNCRCMRICRPNDIINVKIKVIKLRYPLAQFQAYMYVGNEKAAFAESITLTFDYLPQ